MRKFIDLTGMKFNRLTVESFNRNENGQNYWNCICSCGNKVIVNTGRLKYGSIKSCGCQKRDALIRRNTKHSLSNTRLYEIWCGMKKRCYNKKSKSYSNYGGRGISVCDSWKNDFLCFYEWAIKNGYNETLTIERIDVNGNYCPENCKWITLSEQTINLRKTIRYSICGIERPLIEWSKYVYSSYSAIYQRYHYGKPPFTKEEMQEIEEKIRSENNGL